MIEGLHRNNILCRFFYRLAIVAGLLLLLSPMGFCEENPSQALIRPASAAGPLWPHEKSELVPDPSVIYGRMGNGFRYVLMKNQRPRARVSMHLYVGAGSLNETDIQQGLAHYLEHMLFNGSEHFPPGELIKYFQSIGMQFGPDANGHTGFDETVYDIILPKGDGKSIADGLRVMRDYAGGALLLPKEIEKERRVILAEKRSRDSVGYRTFVASLGFKLKGSQVALRLPIGTEACILKADQSRLKDFYDTWYRPDNMVLVLVGDFQTETAKTLIEEAFQSFSPRGPPRAVPDLGEIRHSGIRPFYHYEKEAGNTTVAIETTELVPAVSDSLERQRTMLLEMVANRILQQRLDERIRKPDAPATSAATGSWVFLRRISMSTLQADCEPRQWSQTLAMLDQALRTALTYGFTTPEMDRVTKDLLSEIQNAVKEAPTRESQELAQGILRHIGADRVFMSPEQELDLFGPILENLSIDEVNSAFKKIWRPDHRLVLVTGNARPDGVDGVSTDSILAAYKNSRKISVEKPVEDEAVSFPYLPEPEGPAAVASRVEHNDIGVVQVEFENGTKLHLKRTDFKANEILVRVNFGNGKIDQPIEKPGLSDLGAAAVNESGLGTLDRTQLKRALAGKQTGVSFGIDSNHFYLQGATVSDEVELLFQLLYAHLKDPAIRTDAFELSKKRLGQQLDEKMRTPRGAAAVRGFRFLAGDDNRFGLPTVDDLENLAIEDVRQWLLPEFQNAPLEISVVGDFDIPQVVALAGRYFGSRKEAAVSEKKSERRPPFFPPAASLTMRLDTKIPSALVIIAWPTDDIWNISRTRRLNILADVFSERLREKVREKLGAAYSPFAFNRPSRTYEGYGVFNAFIEVSPKEVDTVVAAVKEIAADLKNNGIQPDELERALEPVRTSIRDMLRTNGYWLTTVLSGSGRHPEQLEWTRTISKDFAAILVKDIEDLAGVYLDNRKASVFVALPK